MINLPLPHVHSGKVRETYEIPDHSDLLLMVASDRISTHNVLHKSLVPTKGELLTALTIFWTFEVLSDIPTHLVVWGRKIYDYLPGIDKDSGLHRRAIIVRKLSMIPIEFVWRQYLTGSLWTLYSDTKNKEKTNPYGLHLAPGLPKMFRFFEPVFTPTEKSKTDDPLKVGEVYDEHPEAVYLTGQVFVRASEYLKGHDIVLIDSKFEVGINDNSNCLLADEWLTGDSSRFAWRHEVREGEDPPWLDKEVFRQDALEIWGSGSRAPLVFSDEVIRLGRDRYYEAFDACTGFMLSEFQRLYLD